VGSVRRGVERVTARDVAVCVDTGVLTSTLRIDSLLEARYRAISPAADLSSLPKWWPRLATARSAPFGVSVLRSPDS
jgi:hypothetical protein